ncbi:MAG: 4Fe-4S binding protein, partial [Planctomycetota bacterium]
CPFDAIHVVDNLAVIDYDKCKLCGKCVKVCPKNVIVNLRKPRRERKKAREAAATGNANEREADGAKAAPPSGRNEAQTAPDRAENS